MAYTSIEIEEFRFSDFAAVRNDVSFCVSKIDDRDMDVPDEKIITELLSNLGNWENLLKVGLNLLSELQVRQIDPAILQRYQKEFDAEKYDCKIALESAVVRRVFIHLAPEERRKRTALGTNETLPIQEIYDQVKNIPKWLSFKKTLKLIRAVT